MQRELKLYHSGKEVVFSKTTLEASTTIQLDKPYRTVYLDHIDTALQEIEKANRLWVYAEREEELTINRICYHGFHVSITKQAASRFYVCVYARRKDSFSDYLTSSAHKKLKETLTEAAICFYRLNLRSIKQETKASYLNYYLQQIATAKTNLGKIENHLLAKKCSLTG